MIIRRLPPMAMLILAICLSPGALLRWKIGQSVAAKMPDLIGPAKSYSADVTGGFFSILRGRIDRIDIHGRGVSLSNGMDIDRLEIGLKDVRFRTDQTVTDIGDTDFSASVTEQNLNDFFAKCRPDMPNAVVKLADGMITMSASPKVLAIRTPVSLEGTLQIVEGNKLNLFVDKLRARGITVPGFVRGRIMHDINPVLDTQRMGINAKLQSVKIGKGEITVTGKADVRQALIGRSSKS